MTKNTIINLNTPEQPDPLLEILRGAGASKLLMAAIEAEVNVFIKRLMYLLNSMGF